MRKNRLSRIWVQANGGQSRVPMRWRLAGASTVVCWDNSLIGAIAPGIQRWAFQGEGVSLWVNAALAVAHQFTGDAEGGPQSFFVWPRLQLGFAY